MATAFGELAAVALLNSRTLELLEEEKDRTQTYLDVAGVIFVVIDANQKVSKVNRKGCHILGYEENEIIGKNWFDNFIPERMKDEVKAVFTRLMAGEVEPVEYFENPVLTRGREERIIAWHNTTLRNKAGRIIGTLNSGEDITKHRQSLNALQESENKFKDLAEKSLVGVYLIQDEIFKYANPMLAEIFGYAVDELTDKKGTG